MDGDSTIPGHTSSPGKPGNKGTSDHDEGIQAEPSHTQKETANAKSTAASLGEEGSRKLYESMSEGLAVHMMIYEQEVAVDYIIADINASYEKITGFTRDSVIGRKASQVYGSMPPPYLDIYARVASTGISEKFETYYPPLSRHFSISVFSPNRGEFATVFRDISQEKETENYIKSMLSLVHEERDKFSSLINSMADEVWFTNPEKKVSLANPSALSRFGIELENELDLEKFSASLEVFRPDGSVRPVEETPPLLALKGVAIRNVEEIVRMPNTGEIRHREVSATPVRDSEGNIIGSVSVVRDITDRKRIEEAFREIESRFLLAIKHAPIAVAIQDADLKYTWAFNPHFFKPLEITGKTDDEILPAETARVMQPFKQKVIRKGRAEHFQQWFNIHEKRAFLDIFLEPIFDKYGAINGVGTVSINLTPMKLIEEELQENKATLMAILNATSESIWLFSPEGKILLVNKTGASRLGLTEDVMIGNHISDYLPPDLMASRMKKLHEVVLTGKPTVFEDERAGMIFEHNFYPVFDAEGKVISVASFSQEITLRKKTERAMIVSNTELEQIVKERTSELKKINSQLCKEIAIRRQQEELLLSAEEKYRTVANFTFNWETWVGPDGKYLYVSPSCHRITGYTVEEFMEDPSLVISIIHPEEREKIETHFQRELKGQEFRGPLDFRIIKKTGEIRWISHNCLPVYDQDHNWMGQRASNKDITDRKLAEEVLIESKSELRALTHRLDQVAEDERIHVAREIHDDLGYMLTVMKYDVDNLINNKDLTVDIVKQDLLSVQTMVSTLIDTVRDIGTELRPGILDHLGLIPAIDWQLKQFSKRTKISTHLNQHIEKVEFDKRETSTIFRMFQEMLSNVGRHASASEVNISLNKKGENFVMTVSDNGKGFDWKGSYMPNSFGLIGMRERALSIGGVISIESKPGMGTAVTFTLKKF